MAGEPRATEFSHTLAGAKLSDRSVITGAGCLRWCDRHASVTSSETRRGRLTADMRAHGGALTGPLPESFSTWGCQLCVAPDMRQSADTLHLTDTHHPSPSEGLLWSAAYWSLSCGWKHVYIMLWFDDLNCIFTHLWFADEPQHTV